MPRDTDHMNDGIAHESNLDYILSVVLRTGLLLAVAIVFCGGVYFLWQNGAEVIDYHLFDGEPRSITSLRGIFDAWINASGGGADKTLLLIQLGIIVLIATPVIRVVTCLIVFAVERDVMYVFISGFVLAMLLYANL